MIREPGTKVCPYCAETIKSEAIVCRFCGRDLKPEGMRTTKVVKKIPSAWVRGAQASAVLTACVLINSVSSKGGIVSVEDIGQAITGFLIWWFISAGVVGLWRKYANRGSH